MLTSGHEIPRSITPPLRSIGREMRRLAQVPATAGQRSLPSKLGRWQPSVPREFREVLPVCSDTSPSLPSASINVQPSAAPKQCRTLALASSCNHRWVHDLIRPEPKYVTSEVARSLRRYTFNHLGCRNEPAGNQLPSRPNSRWTDRPVAADCVVSMFPLLKRPCSDQFAGARSQCTDCRHQSATDRGYHWVEEACCQRLRAHHVLVDDRTTSGLSGSSLPIIRLNFAASSLRHTNQNNLTFRPSL